MSHKNVSLKCLIKMSHENVSSKCFIKISLIKMYHQNVSSKCLYFLYFLYIVAGANTKKFCSTGYS